MSDSIAQAVSEIKHTRVLSKLDEASVKQGIVLRLFQLAGWDVFDLSEVLPEYAVGTRRVDYALKTGTTNRVFVEVKRPSESLEDNQQQLLDYCFQQGVKLAVLTNGRTWWLYLPLHEGSWEQRRFLTIDLESQEPPTVESRFNTFLSRAAVSSGSAVDAAEELIRSLQTTETIEETLPKAWQELLTKPDELLVDLVSAETERICGFKPDNDMVKHFLARITSAHPTPPAAVPPSQATPKQVQKSYPKSGVTGKKPTSFTLLGQNRRVDTWIDLLFGVCESVHNHRRNEFAKVLNLRGTKRRYFSKDGTELKKPRLLRFAGLHVETNLSANQIVSLCHDIIRLLGFPTDALDIQVD